MANMVAATELLNKVVLRAACYFEYKWWIEVKMARRNNPERGGGRKNWKKRRKNGEMFLHVSVAGSVAWHPVPEFLLGLLLLKCLCFPMGWSLCLTITRMTDPTERETFQYWTLCLSAGHLSHSIPHLAQQQRWRQLFYPFSEQNRNKAFPTSIQSLTPPSQTTLLSYKFKPPLVTNYVRSFSPWTS